MPESPSPAAPQQVPSLLMSATQLLRAGRPADAIVPLHRAALLEPFNATIQHDLGLACLEVGRLHDAVAAFEHAVAANPRYADAYFNLALLCERNSEVLRAIGYWQTYLKLDTGSSWAQAAKKQLDRLKKTVRHK